MNGQQLKDILFQALEDLKSNAINVQEATAISSLSKEIVRVTNTQLKIRQFANLTASESLKDFSND